MLFLPHYVVCLPRVYSRAQSWRIPQFGKRMPHKIYVAGSNGVQKKIDPRISIQKHHWQRHWFDGRSINLLWAWTFIASYCLNCLSLLHLSHYINFDQTNIWDSTVIQAQAFSVAQNVPKWQQSINKCSFSHGTVLSVPTSSNTSWGTPFLEKERKTLTGQFLE